METTSATAMLVGTRDMLDAHPNAVTATISRDEIEEALSSDATELILDVLRPTDGGAVSGTVVVAWDRGDLESLLAAGESDAVTFTFDRDELEQALGDPEFEGHGLREAALIVTVAAVAAVGASAASGMDYREQGTPTAGVAAAAPAGHDEATLAARGIDTAASVTAAPDAFERAAARGAPAVHDETTLASRGIDVQPVAGHDEATLVARGIVSPDPVGESGSGLELPTLEAPTVGAVAAGLAGAGLVIVAAGFAARRNRVRPL